MQRTSVVLHAYLHAALHPSPWQPTLIHAALDALLTPAPAPPPLQDCVGKTIARVQLKLEQQRVLAHVVYMMRSSNKEIQRYVATSMARLAPTTQLKSIFCDKSGLDILLDMLTTQPANSTAMRESAQALLELAKKVGAQQGAMLASGMSPPCCWRCVGCAGFIWAICPGVGQGSDLRVQSACCSAGGCIWALLAMPCFGLLVL
jgi:hypothetical protein